MKIGFAVDLDVKAISDDGEFSGYASTFGNVDLGRDVVVKGAFAQALNSRPPVRVKMLRQHDRSEPVGVWTSLEEDDHGLKAAGRLILETVKGRETYALMKAGAYDALSIGSRVIKHRWDRAKSVRFLEQLDLPEISIVTIGMNPMAMISAVKSDDDRARATVQQIRKITEALRA